MEAAEVLQRDDGIENIELSYDVDTEYHDGAITELDRLHVRLDEVCAGRFPAGPLAASESSDEPEWRRNRARMTKRALSTLFWTFVAVSSMVLYPVAVLIWVVTVAFDRRLVVLHRFTCFWASLYTWCNPVWPVTIEGREKIRPGTAYVMVANHLSLLDILVLFRLFRHFKWVSKIENFKVPFIGWNMSMNRYIKLRRGDRESIVQMMAACEKTIGEGSSIMIFPEGTRSSNGEMRPFKPGAFELALKTRTPILPIVVVGTADALPKRGFVLQGRHPIRIGVLDPIPPERCADMSVDELAAHVRELIARELVDTAPGSTSPGSTSPGSTSSGHR